MLVVYEEFLKEKCLSLQQSCTSHRIEFGYFGFGSHARASQPRIITAIRIWMLKESQFALFNVLDSPSDLLLVYRLTRSPS
jgi:hypothetical protein